MTLEARRQYLTAIRERYRQSTKKEKGTVTQVCGYSRKYAIRILTGRVEPRTRKPGPKPKYGQRFVLCLKELWEAMGRICSKKMVVAIRDWLPNFKSRLLAADVKRQLREVSPATIDRLLRPFRHAPARGLSTTISAHAQGKIPIELLHGETDRPGYIEADTVGHCGTALGGRFAYSITATDLASGWTENRACLGKDAETVVDKIDEIERALPVKMLGFACDNGSEFLNYDLIRFFNEGRKEPVKFTRRRPYKKNDAAHVEQKNWTHVRQLFGYDRIEDPATVAIMNEIYRAYWNPLQNFFIPCMKLVKKERVGAKIKKTYDQPKTPYQRLLENEHLHRHIKERLRIARQWKNPFTLRQELNRRLRDFVRLVELERKRRLAG